MRGICAKRGTCVIRVINMRAQKGDSPPLCVPQSSMRTAYLPPHTLRPPPTFVAPAACSPSASLPPSPPPLPSISPFTHLLSLHSCPLPFRCSTLPLGLHSRDGHLRHSKEGPEYSHTSPHWCQSKKGSAVKKGSEGTSSPRWPLVPHQARSTRYIKIVGQGGADHTHLSCLQLCRDGQLSLRLGRGRRAASCEGNYRNRGGRAGWRRLGLHADACP